MKLILPLVAALGMALGANAEESAVSFPLNGLTYQVVDENMVAVSAGTSVVGAVEIPETVFFDRKTYGVTAVADDGFANCGELSAITFPATLTSIGERAFRNCKKLQTVGSTEAVEKLGKECFANCSALTSVEFENVESVPENAFQNCTSMTSANMPCVFAINDGAFQSCEMLEETRFSSVIYWIGERAFLLCWSLKSFDIPEGCIIGKSAFYSAMSLNDLVIPYRIDSLGEAAFSGCSHLTTVYLLCDDYQSFADINDGLLDTVEGRRIYCAPAIADYVSDHTDNSVVNLNTIMRPLPAGSDEDEFAFFLDPISIPGNPIEGPVIVRQPGSEGETLPDSDGKYVIKGDKALISWTFYGTRLTYYIHKPAQSAIAEVRAESESTLATFFALDGRIAGNDAKRLTPGIYIVDRGGVRSKIAIGR